MRQFNVYTGVVLVLGSSLLFACGSSSSAAPATTAGGAGTDAAGGSSAGTTGKGGTSAAGTTGTGGMTTGTGGMTTMGTGGSAGAGTAGKGGSAGMAAGGGTGKGGSAGKGGAAGMGAGGMGAGGMMMITAACDPIKKTGCTGTKKCVSEPAGMDTVQACEDPGAGPPVTMEGGDCKRTSLGIGDNCAPGLICTLRGVLDGDSMNKHTQCRKYCQDDTQCADNQLCNEFTADGFGVCIDACLPFTPCSPASQSGMGMGGAGGSGAGGSGAAGKGGAGGGAATVSCSDIYKDNTKDPMTGKASFDFFGCKLVGSGAIGDSCMTSKDCGVNQFCAADPNNPGAPTGICTEWCQLADPMAMPPVVDHMCTKMGQSCASVMAGEINICM